MADLNINISKVSDHDDLENCFKRNWTAKEDKELAKLVETHGKRWSFISKIMKSRNPRQCRERWHIKFNPQLVKGSWAPEEDTTLTELYCQLGNSWSVISKSLPGRDKNNIRNRAKAIQRECARNGYKTIQEANDAKYFDFINLRNFWTNFEKPVCGTNKDIQSENEVKKRKRLKESSEESSCKRSEVSVSGNSHISQLIPLSPTSHSSNLISSDKQDDIISNTNYLVPPGPYPPSSFMASGHPYYDSYHTFSHPYNYHTQICYVDPNAIYMYPSYEASIPSYYY